MEQRNTNTLLERIWFAIGRAKCDHGDNREITVHATHEAICELRTHAYKNGSVAFHVRTDKDPIHCEVFGYKIIPVYGRGASVELRVQVCGNEECAVTYIC